MHPPARVWPGVLLSLALSHIDAAGAAPACDAPPSPGDAARVSSVIDGDTVVLSDSTHVRLIGIDTPEIGRRGEPSEPGALEARAFLSNLLRDADSVRLVRDAEPWDRYGRRLAHLFVGGANVEARILAEGFAVPLTMPPNVLLVDCYGDAAGAARQARRGLWAMPRYAPIDAQDLARETRGYRVVRGRVARIGHGATSTWLEFTPRFAAWVAAQDVGYFGPFDFSAQIGRLVEVRGKVYSARGQLRMRLRHPLDFSVIPEAPAHHDPTPATH